MKFNSEKELAILLVSMVCFMVLQTVCMIHLDRRVDRLMNDNARIQQEVQEELDAIGKKHQRTTHKTKRFFPMAEEYQGFADALNAEVLETSDGIGYDFDEMCRVITAEGGTDSEICLAVAQCLYNACERNNWRYSPTEMLIKYHYTSPVDWVSDEAFSACSEVFLYGNSYEAVRDATLFYAPQYCDSEWHEKQNFVCEINGVRFFSEND